MNFRPGMYRHYKGDLYTALMLVHHHETRELMVIYLSHTHGTLNARPLHTPGQDSWLDMVSVSERERVPRFKYIGPEGGPSQPVSTSPTDTDLANAISVINANPELNAQQKLDCIDRALHGEPLHYYYRRQ